MVEQDENRKVYFNSGDIVRLKSMDSPDMLVQHPRMVGRSDQKKELDGIMCVWFDDFGKVVEHKWNSKDLEIVKKR